MKKLIILFFLLLSCLTSCSIITYKYNLSSDAENVAENIAENVAESEPSFSIDIDALEAGELVNLGPAINTIHSELAPIISPDGKILYFVREEHEFTYQKIFLAKKSSNDKFFYAHNIGKPLNKYFISSGVLSALPDGNSLLIFGNYNDHYDADDLLHLTYKINNSTWSKPKSVHIINLYNYGSQSNFCLAPNGRTLLMALTRKDSYGYAANITDMNKISDLYVSFLQSDGRWSEPKNLGSDINTESRECTPFLAADGVTLYFSSNGHPGYGNNDIFVSRRLDDSWTKWSKPINLGPKINSSGWDAYFTIPASGDYAYMVSGKDGGYGQEDIYMIKMSEEFRPEPVILVFGKVLDKKNNKPIGAEIIYEKLSTGEIIGSARSNPETGEYKIVLSANEKYSFRAEAKGFIPINENLDLLDLKEYSELNRDLYLISPFEKGQTIRINNIFFNTAKSDLLPESYPELNRLVNFLNENPNITIKILGHTDNIGKKEDNLKLSNARAESVRNYLISQGINNNRITSEGFGFSKPIATNETEEGRALNRRVEFQIITY